MATQKLPSFLSDLDFSLDKQRLQLHAVPGKKNVFSIGLEADHHYGLLVNFKEQSAELKDGYSLTQYHNGYTTTYTQWDDCEPDSYKAGSFETWVREALLKDIHRQLSWHIESFLEDDIASNIDALILLCEDFAQLPEFEFTHYGNKSLHFTILAAIHRSRENQSISDSDRRLFESFMEEFQKDSTESAQQILSVILALMPEIPTVISEYYHQLLETRYGLNSEEELPLEYLSYQSNFVAKMSKNERSFHNAALLQKCTSSAHCHTMAAALSDYPEESRAYIEKGLSFTPDDLSLLIFAETFYLNQKEDEQLKDVRRRITALDGTSGSDNNIQDTINRYTQLCNDYQYFSPSTDSSVTAIELLELEGELNQYWLGQLPPPTSLNRDLVETQLIAQQRFLSSGSASVVGWLRNCQRYQEVVDYTMTIVDQVELNRLRHHSNTRGFEAFINNALGAFLDSQDEAHIQQAIQLMDGLERAIPTWKSRDGFYNRACVAARAGQIERALNCIKEMKRLKFSIQEMKWDSDLKILHQHPDFLALFGANA